MGDSVRNAETHAVISCVNDIIHMPFLHRFAKHIIGAVCVTNIAMMRPVRRE